MSDYPRLSSEILLMIANYIRNDSEDVSSGNVSSGYTNLRQLALSFKDVRPAAQEVLHTEVVIQEHLDVDLPGPTRTARLARTLLSQREGIASKVRYLSLQTTNYPMTHSITCANWTTFFGPGCSCGKDAIIKQCTKFLEDEKNQHVRNTHWQEKLDEGFDSAFAAMVLCVVTNVKTLIFRHRFHDMFHYIDWPGLVPGQCRLVPNIYYDDLLESQELSTKLIKDLAHVTQVRTDSFPPVSILQLPKLETLELRLFDNHGSWDLPNTMTYKPLDPMLYSVLTRLFVYLDISALCSSNGGIYDHLKKTIKDLPSLTSLSLYFCNVFIDRGGRGRAEDL
jgi:hypothetical protein